MKTSQSFPAAPHGSTLAAAHNCEASSSQPQGMASRIRWHVDPHQSIVTHTTLPCDSSTPPSMKQFAINSSRPPKRTKCHTALPDTHSPPVEMPRYQVGLCFPSTTQTKFDSHPHFRVPQDSCNLLSKESLNCWKGCLSMRCPFHNLSRAAVDKKRFCDA